MPAEHPTTRKPGKATAAKPAALKPAAPADETSAAAGDISATSALAIAAAAAAADGATGADSATGATAETAPLPDAAAPFQAGPFNLWDELSHPLAVKFSELAAELEQLPAHVLQTRLVADLSALRQRAQDFLNFGGPAPVLDGPAEGLVRVKVTGPKAGRWRAGLHFTPDPATVDVTPAQLDQLKADPSLTVVATG